MLAKSDVLTFTFFQTVCKFCIEAQVSTVL